MCKPNAEALTGVARQSVYLSHFTPSMMPAQTLEALLVKRESLIDRVVKSAVESVKTDGKHHHLFVGPRGIGKTHVISLLHHRLSQNKTIQTKAKIVWMREEEWGVTSFFELVLRILRNLDQSEPMLGIQAEIEELYSMTVKQAEHVACDLLLKMLNGKTLIILLENLDDLFEQMGDSGQKKWRAFIQNHPQFVMLCTTPALFQGVTSQKSAFYGSFDVESLDEFSFDEVVELLRKIADYRGDKDLVDFINTAEGRARIRAVHHLAQGNPRIYIIFAQFLSKVELDELVQAFMHTLDELTPFYQARMKELSGQQRKILELLVQFRGGLSVKDIAQNSFITQQACASQLKILRERRFVRSIEIGRNSFYELSEPLMRYCLEIKRQKGEYIELIIDFLRLVYSNTELRDWLEKARKNQNTLEEGYLIKPLEKIKKLGDSDLKAELLIKEVRDNSLKMKYSQLLKLEAEFDAITPSNTYRKLMDDAMNAHIPESVQVICKKLFLLDEFQNPSLQKLKLLTGWAKAGVTIKPIVDFQKLLGYPLELRSIVSAMPDFNLSPAVEALINPSRFLRS